ncbi:MAG: hypothetical protein ACOC5A_05475, partial [Halanaerobiales bacterium]
MFTGGKNINSGKNKKIPFLIAVSYLFSFLFIRLLVLLVGSANSEVSNIVKQGAGLRFYIGRNIILFGYHIHHFFFGMLFIAIAGWLLLLESKFFSREKLALIYGA